MLKLILLSIISLYKGVISPMFFTLFGRACRFTPTCSDYAMISIKRYGVIKGSVLSVLRISKCHPFSTGYYDPLPETI